MAQASAPPPGASGDAEFNIDDFNKIQVGMPAGKTVDEIVLEIRSNLQRDVALVLAADDALIAKHFKAPWGTEGPVGDMIVSSLDEHLRMHLSDLKGATA